MYSLSKAGVPIIRAIGGLAESHRNLYFREVLQQVRADLEGGMNMAVALHAHPKVFTTLFISMVSVGENTGQLDQAFRQLAGYLELERETRKRIKQATRYPLFVLIAMAVALVVINLLVIPAFAKVFEQFKADLPWPTQVLIGTSQFFQDFWWLLLLLFGGGLYAFFKWIETDAGALKWDATKLRLPIVGGIFERIALARFTRTFAMMYKAGVPLLQTLSINSASVGNRHIGQAILGHARGGGAWRGIDPHRVEQRPVHPAGAADDGRGRGNRRPGRPVRRGGGLLRAGSGLRPQAAGRSAIEPILIVAMGDNGTDPRAGRVPTDVGTRPRWPRAALMTPGLRQADSLGAGCARLFGLGTDPSLMACWRAGLLALGWKIAEVSELQGHGCHPCPPG